MDELFYKLGRQTRRTLLRGQWLWSSLAGSEEEALAAEYAAGCDLARSYDRNTRFDDAQRSRELLEHVTAQLTGRLSNKQRRWRVLPILAESPGAFALPGGFLYLTRSLLELCNYDEDEIANVVGHEMGHVVRGHAIERISNHILATSALRVAPLPAGLLAQWVVGTGAKLLTRSYSQDQELAADEFGARLAAAAGFDPRAAIQVLSRLQQLESKEGFPLAEYFATHPPLELRIEKLRNQIRMKGT